ncbi:hypothetical protein B0T11DRAFT_287518 [Plectosphaerella cucumerina]|uniref:Enoyl reductase (ER) domain-containing protein n=1 Tax=Plectosphaerella cucumerina TaxID=40658 RepID=A0A8K0TCI8_9PEZI|nr:hypothetical protein B0T11DRAFT_287518 [Plectosphaerella cucumerina]
MSSHLSTSNTSPTPDQPGRWVVTEFGKPSVLQWQHWDSTLELSDDQVLIRIIVAGIAGVDNIQRAGGYPADPRASKPGFTTGFDLVGEVVGLGNAVPDDANLKVGDRVTSLCVLGAHATHILLHYADVIRIERSDDPIKIGAIPLNYMTAWGMLKHSGVELPPGSTILIGAASGGLGTAVAQLVKAFNMGIRMIGTCSPSKFDYVTSLGIEPIDRNALDLVEQVRNLTDGEGVDVAYDGVCSEESLKNSLAATKADIGKVIVFGSMGNIAADGSGVLKSTHEILAERLQPPRITFYGLDTKFYKKAEMAEFQAILGKVRSKELDPVVFKLMRLSEAREAHGLLISGGSVKGKMMFVVDAGLAAQYGI